jgi:hypothetical protein
MWRRCAYWSGVALILTALAAVPSVAIVPSYVGGSAIDGHVEDGRYFVNPSHGRPIAEVSESTWRALYWVERLWPFSALIPGLTGLFLVGYGKRPNWKPPPPPPKRCHRGCFGPVLRALASPLAGRCCVWLWSVRRGW